jgi:hypothetical protein
MNKPLSKTPRDPELKGKRITVKAGAIFEIPAPDGRLGYGVAIVGGGVPYVIILKSLHKERPPVSDLTTDEIALAGWTTDAQIYHGRWTLVGADYPPRPDVPFPNFKVRIDGSYQTTDFRGNVLGPSTPDEIELLAFQTSSSAIIYQDALMAIHGFCDWEDYYEKLLPAHALARMSRSSNRTRQDTDNDRNHQSGHRRLDLRALARRLLP